MDGTGVGEGTMNKIPTEMPIILGFSNENSRPLDHRLVVGPASTQEKIMKNR